jgi:pheromone shutdown protein TraB
MAKVKIIIIGTSHISPGSVAATRDRILSEQPDCVAVELDPLRYRALLNPQPPSLRAGVTTWLLHSLQSRLGKLTGVLPGSEMLAAIDAGRAVGARVVLIDMSIQRIAAEMQAIPLLRKLRLFSELLVGATLGPKVVDLSKVPEERLVKQVMREMARSMPDYYRILVTERNAYMVEWIRKLAEENNKVVVVVGLGHKEGLQKLLRSKTK